MEKEVYYPTAEKIIEFNFLILKLIKVKKADKSVVLSYGKINEIIDICKKEKGNLYDKAAILLKEIIQKHPFASGNRRTAFVVAKDFLLKNNAKFGISDDPTQAKIMIGIREHFYTNEEIKEWIQNGKIREFKR